MSGRPDDDAPPAGGRWAERRAEQLPNDLFSRFERLTEVVDGAAGAYGAAHPEEIACRAGCSDCCGSFFEVSLLEGLYLLRGVATLPAERQARAVGRALSNVQALGRILSKKDPYAGVSESFTRDLSPEEGKARVGLYCPLLDDDGRCSIYAWRPAVCRYHGPPRWHAAQPDEADYCYLNCRGHHARGEAPDAALVMDTRPWREKLEELAAELGAAVFGSRHLRFQAPISDFVVAASRTLGEWNGLLAPLTDRVFVAVRRFYEVHGDRAEARRTTLDPYATERSQDWASANLSDEAVAEDLDRVINACLDRLSGQRIDDAAIAGVLRQRGAGFRRHALLVTLQVTAGGA